MKIILFSFLLFSVISFNLMSQSLRINEIMASNVITIADEDGEFSDWLELYNGTDSIINLKSFWLSDNLSSPDKWKFPDVLIYPEQYLIIFTSGKDKYNGSYIHTNFKISIDGEPILLSDSMGNAIDYYPPVVLTTDNSYGCFPDDCSNLVFFEGSSPGYTNNLLSPLNPLTDTVYFSVAEGFYITPFSLQITNLDQDATIYYTTNGSEPDTTSCLYASSIYIYDKTSLPNNLSSIPTNASDAQHHPYIWRPPLNNVFKGTVVKARAFKNGIPTSELMVASYFVNQNIFTRYNNLPLISIVIDSMYLFDYNKGIYVPGKMYDDNLNYPDWWGYGNYFGRGFLWEKPANITMFEGNGNLAFSQKIGVRVHGNSSRALPLKTLRLYARNLYGDKFINFKFFPWTNVNEYKRIQLSSSGNDFPYTMFADALSAVIVRDFNFEKQNYRPAVVFINGEFWGIHNIRDRLDENYIEYMFHYPPEKIDFLYYWGVASVGDVIFYNNMIDFIKNNDLVDNVNYDSLAHMMDIDNFIDYIIAKQYTAVYDWPGNNVNLWRPRTADGKFRWIFIDNDQCLDNYSFDAIAHSTLEGGTTWPNPDESTFLLRNLLKNDNFKAAYLEKFEYHLMHSFSQERITFLLDSIYAIIEPVMKEHINRWQYPSNYDEWQDNVQKMRDFAKLRPCYMKEHLINHFNIVDSNYASSVCNNAFFPADSVKPDLNISSYPNPAKDIINVTFKGFDITDVQYFLFDVAGRMILERNAVINNKKEISIPVNGLSKGVYLLKVVTLEKTKYLKVVLS